MSTTFNISRTIFVLQHITSNKTKKIQYDDRDTLLSTITSNGLRLTLDLNLVKNLWPSMPKGPDIHMQCFEKKNYLIL